MYIDQLKLWNFRSFGSSADEPVATLGATARVLNMDPASSVFIGRNGAGKSALVQSLLRLFGETRDERSIQAGDFFVPPTERLESQTLRRLFIEATIRFPELETGGSEAEKTVPPAFRHMVVEKAGVVPHIRIRLEATWQLAGTLDGVVEETLYWILGDNVVPFGEADPSLKKKVSVAERSHIVVRYIPASRDVTALTQLTVKSLGRNLMKSIRWEKKAEIDALISEAASKLDQEGGLTRVNAAINSCWSQLNTAETGTTASLSVLAPDLQQIVRTATVMLTPSATGRLMTLEDLSDGQRSLFHFALVKALLDLKLILEGEVAAGDDLPFHPEFSRAPALTVFAFEEPENHLSPFFLSRLLSELGKLTDNPRVQAVLTSHAPAIVGRIDPSAFLARGIALRNEDRDVGGASIQDLMTETYSRILMDMLELLTRRHGGALWSTTVGHLASVRGLVIDDDTTIENELAVELDRFHRDNRMSGSESATPADVTAKVAAIESFLGLPALRAAAPQYSSEDFFDRIRRATVSFLSEIAAKGVPWSKLLETSRGINEVPLLTITKSKGLEYDLVILLGLNDQEWWSFDKDPGEGHSNFFVAASRARERLLMTRQGRDRNSKIRSIFDLLAAAGVPQVAA